MTDETLFEAYRAGDGSALDELSRRHHTLLVGYLRLQYRNDADDIAQRTWLKVIIKRNTFRDGYPFKPWLYAIALKDAVDICRHNGRRSAITLDLAGHIADPTLPDPSEQLADRETAADCMALLTDQEREVFGLLAAGHTKAEASRQAGIPLRTVKGVVRRMRNLLRHKAA